MAGLVSLSPRIMYLRRAVAVSVATLMVSILGAGAASADELTVASAPTLTSVTPSVGDDEGSAILVWEAPSSDGGSPITSYVVQWRSGLADWDSERSLVVSPPATTADVPGLTNGIAYEFRVAAVNSVGEGPFSEVSDPVTPLGPPPAPPATWGPLVPAESSVSLTWYPPEGNNTGGSPITGYALEQSDDQGVTWASVEGRAGDSATSFIVTGLANRTGYLFRVAAVNEYGPGPWLTTPRAVTPRPTPLVAVVQAPRAAVLGEKATFTWAVAGGAKGSVLARTITIKGSNGARVAFSDPAKKRARQGTVTFVLRKEGVFTIRLSVTATAPDGSVQRESATDTIRGKAVYRTSVDSRLTRADLPYSYRPGCPVRPSELARITIPYWNFDGEVYLGELVVAKTVVDDMIFVFRRAYQARFPIRSMIPIDAFYAGGTRAPDEADIAAMAADNTSAFNCRPVVGSGGSALSPHASGEALDINPFENPYVTAGGTYPRGSAERFHRDRAANLRAPGVMTASSPIVRALKSRGWIWGAAWRYPDYQHWQSRYPMWP